MEKYEWLKLLDKVQNLLGNRLNSRDSEATNSESNLIHT